MQVYNFFRFGLRQSIIDTALIDLGLAAAVVKQDVKTRWLSHLPVFERIVQIYPGLLLALDRAPAALPADRGMNSRALQMQLRDVFCLLGFVLSKVLLKPMQKLVKLLQDRAQGAGTLQLAIGEAQAALQTIFIDERTALSGTAFDEFNSLMAAREASKLGSNGMWLEAERVTLYIKCRDGQGHVHKWQAQAQPHDDAGEPESDGLERVHPGALQQIGQRAIAAAVADAQHMLQGLVDKFPQMVLLDAAGTVCPEVLCKHTDDALRMIVGQAIAGLREYASRPVMIDGELVQPPFSPDLLFTQTSAFLAAKGDLPKRVMQLSAAEAPNKTAYFWRTLVKEHEGTLHTFAEWVRFAKWSIAQLIGSVDDERRLSALEFIRNKQRNELDEQSLNDCLRVYQQPWYSSLEQVPLAELIDIWLGKKSRRFLKGERSDKGKTHATRGLAGK